MSSILTNNSAMVALQTMKSINSNLGNIQSQISTGLEVGSAKDNAAVFAISEVMKSDVTGFDAISDSLSLGSSTVSVASSAAETLNATLDEIKSKVVSANEDNVDKATLQSEITSLLDQLGSTVEAAQFNGLNLLDGSTGGNVSFLSSMNRDSSGTVTTSTIDLNTTNTNLSTEAGAAVDGFGATVGNNGAGSSFASTVAASGNFSVVFEDPAAANQSYEVTLGEETFSYKSVAGDDAEAVARAFLSQIEDSGINVDLDDTATAGTLAITNNDATNALAISGNAQSGGTGGLAEVAGIDVTVDAAAALTAVNKAIETVIGVQSDLGTTEKRMEIQSDFLSKLSDSFTSGIGSLVDADMEEASAKLSALQVQQQLSTQALSIANSAPQQLLSLFR